MDLRRVWVIVRSGSQTAERIANRCRDQLEARGCAVICSTSGLTTNPYPGLLADDLYLHTKPQKNTQGS